MFSTVLNGQQIDLHPAVVVDSNNSQIGYQQISFSRGIAYTSDQNDEFAGQPINFGNGNNVGNGGIGGMSIGNIGNIVNGLNSQNNDKGNSFWLKGLLNKANVHMKSK